MRKHIIILFNIYIIGSASAMSIIDPVVSISTHHWYYYVKHQSTHVYKTTITNKSDVDVWLWFDCKRESKTDSAIVYDHFLRRGEGDRGVNLFQMNMEPATTSPMLYVENVFVKCINPKQSFTIYFISDKENDKAQKSLVESISCYQISYIFENFKILKIMDKNSFPFYQHDEIIISHDYTVSGVPATRLGQAVDHHLHTGKPWQGFNGLGWYDNRARVLDALTGRFTTPAPLAEHYPDQSPYAHCAGNPVRFIDPTGRVLEYPSSPSNMSFNYKMRDVRAYVGTDIKEIEEKLRNPPHHFMVFDANREGGGNRIRTSIFNKDEEGNTIYQVEIYVDLDNANILDDNNTMSPAMAAFHEFVHAEAIADNGELYFKNVRTFDEQYGNLEERRNIEYIENPKATELGEPIRKNHKFRDLEKVDDVRFHKTNGKEYFK